jgi:uncharacterized membrane protein
MVVALFASLALNLIVAGATAGFVWRHGSGASDTAARNLPPNLLGYATTLPPARQEEINARTQEQRQHVRPLRRQLREAREEVVQVLVAEPFDKGRFEAAQARLLIADQKARDAVHLLFAALAAQMTPEERRGFVEWRQKRRPMRNPLDEPEKQASEQSR